MNVFANNALLRMSLTRHRRGLTLGGNMKKAVVALLSYPALVATTLASGYEYHRMVAGFHIGDIQFGFTNFKHVSSGEIQGRILFEPLGTMTLPFTGEVALCISFSILVIAGCIIFLGVKQMRKMKANRVAGD